MIASARPEVDDDRALLEAADDPVHDLALAIAVLVEDVVALGVAQALDDHLLRGLGEDAAEVRGVELDADLVAGLDLGIVVAARLGDQDLGVRIRDLFDDLAELEELDLADLVVVTGLDLLVLAEAPARGLAHRLFEGARDLLGIDALVLGNLIDFSLEISQHHTPPDWLESRSPRLLREVGARELIDRVGLLDFIERNQGQIPVHVHLQYARLERHQATAVAFATFDAAAGSGPGSPSSPPLRNPSPSRAPDRDPATTPRAGTPPA